MKFRFHVSYLAFALALATAIMTPAMASESNKETRMQTNVPLQIPGRVLEPGTYIFRLADSFSNRDIVEVFSEDANGNQTFVTTLMAISAYRQQTPDKPIFNMDERPAGTPEAIRSWFYPGDNTGWEFVYSKPYPTAQNQVAAVQPAPAPVEPPAPPAEPEAASAPEPAPVEEAASRKRSSRKRIRRWSRPRARRKFKAAPIASCRKRPGTPRRNCWRA